MSIDTKKKIYMRCLCWGLGVVFVQGGNSKSQVSLKEIEHKQTIFGYAQNAPENQFSNYLPSK